MVAHNPRYPRGRAVDRRAYAEAVDLTGDEARRERSAALKRDQRERERMQRARPTPGPPPATTDAELCTVPRHPEHLVETAHGPVPWVAWLLLEAARLKPAWASVALERDGECVLLRCTGWRGPALEA